MKKSSASIDDKSKFLYAVIIAILLIAVAFFAGYRNMESSAAKYEAENANLQSRIDSLVQYYETEEQNKADTEAMTQAIADIFSTYPGDARFEDGIYEAFNLYGGSFDSLQLESIGFANSFSVKDIPIEIVQSAQIEGYDQEINFNQFDVSYSGQVTYEGLKGMVREIANGKYNLAIGNMSYEITDTGYIDGKTQLSFYSVNGAGLSYTEPPVEEYETGIQNLFGVTMITTEEDEEVVDK